MPTICGEIPQTSTFEEFTISTLQEPYKRNDRELLQMQLRCQVLKDTALMAAMTMDLQLPKGRWHEVSWEVDSHGPMQAISFGHLFLD